MKNIKAVIFDFDYTLVDSSQGIIECINYALRGLEFTPVTAEAACETIGLSLGDTFIKLTGINNMLLKEGFIKLFVKRSDEIMVGMTYVFENVPDTVNRLKTNGIKLGIVSTKFRYRIETTLAQHGMSEVFDIIIGGEDVLSHKPDPEGLNTAIKKLELQSSDVLYVGDSVIDAEAARRAGIAFAAVLSGVTKRDAFLNYSRCSVCENMEDVSNYAIS